MNKNLALPSNARLRAVVMLLLCLEEKQTTRCLILFFNLSLSHPKHLQ